MFRIAGAADEPGLAWYNVVSHAPDVGDDYRRSKPIGHNQHAALIDRDVRQDTDIGRLEEHLDFVVAEESPLSLHHFLEAHRRDVTANALPVRLRSAILGVACHEESGIESGPRENRQGFDQILETLVEGNVSEEQNELL